MPTISQVPSVSGKTLLETYLDQLYPRPEGAKPRSKRIQHYIARRERLQLTRIGHYYYVDPANPHGEPPRRGRGRPRKDVAARAEAAE